jgi:hypothetical protein
MKRLILLSLLIAPVFGQGIVRWAATTGDMTLSAATTVTIQQPASSTQNINLDEAVVYCSVACTVTQAANGTAATSTAGTVTPILPTPLATVVPVTFWTTSNVGTGTAQGGAVHIPAGSTVTFCLSAFCGATADVDLLPRSTGSNYSISIASMSGTANITVYGRARL